MEDQKLQYPKWRVQNERSGMAKIGNWLFLIKWWIKYYRSNDIYVIFENFVFVWLLITKYLPKSVYSKFF